MLRKRAKFINIIWQITDLILLIGTFYASYYIRFTYIPLKYNTVPEFERHLSYLAIILFLWFIFARIFKLYQSGPLDRITSDWNSIIFSTFLTIIAYSFIGFASKSLEMSRLTLSLFFFLTIFVLGIWHQFVHFIFSVARRKGYNQRFFLIVGTSQTAIKFSQHITAHPEFGIQILGFVDDSRYRDRLNNSQYKYIGGINDIKGILKSRVIDRVIIALPFTLHKKIAQVIEYCDYEGVEANIIPDLFHHIKLKTKIYDFDGMPIIGIRSTPCDSIQYIYLKRIFDIIFSSIALVVTSPIILISGILIKLTSPGPIIFKQTRVGYGGKKFIFYKLRTMEVSPANESDKTWTTADDERRTNLGIFLRRTCIDELPQFWNVLKGDMSIVGPRPERPYFIKEFQKAVPKYMVRHQVKSGITGWAQINGYRGDTSIPKRIEFDLYYIENWSLSFDLKIIWLTIFQGVHGKNSY